ncbi:MAG: hypothetical protein ABFD89_27715 [Bryobacteraceae bacterium]
MDPMYAIGFMLFLFFWIFPAVIAHHKKRGDGWIFILILIGLICSPISWAMSLLMEDLSNVKEVAPMKKVPELPCPKCGFPFAYGSKFCRKCGHYFQKADRGNG